MTLNAPQAGPATTALTVSQVTVAVKRALHAAFPEPIEVVGEIGSFKAHSSGHLYFTLKDANSELACVMWRQHAQALKFQPQTGLRAIASGELGVFDRAGRYQLYVDGLRPEGTGALELALRQLQGRLQAEGLFDETHKKALPKLPRHIAIVTSPTGAALRDILQTLQRRFPCCQVSIMPVIVQGDRAASQIARAIRAINKHRAALSIDVLIVGRGGGSLEDLWAFNEEPVVRAVYASQVPVISAVGHEVDFTLCDAVADIRAATPTAAAELAVPERRELFESLQSCQHRMRRVLAQRVLELHRALDAVSKREPLRAPQRMATRRVEQLDQVHGNLRRALRSLHDVRARQLATATSRWTRHTPRRNLNEALAQLQTLQHRLQVAVSNRRHAAVCDLARLADTWRLGGLAPRAERCRQKIDALQANLRRGVRLKHRAAASKSEALADRLAGLGYCNTLARGYTVTRVQETGKLITDPQQTRSGMAVETETAHGPFTSTVGSPPDQMSLFE